MIPQHFTHNASLFLCTVQPRTHQGSSETLLRTLGRKTVIGQFRLFALGLLTSNTSTFSVLNPKENGFCFSCFGIRLWEQPQVGHLESKRNGRNIIRRRKNDTTALLTTDMLFLFADSFYTPQLFVFIRRDFFFDCESYKMSKLEPLCCLKPAASATLHRSIVLNV